MCHNTLNSKAEKSVKPDFSALKFAGGWLSLSGSELGVWVRGTFNREGQWILHSFWEICSCSRLSSLRVTRWCQCQCVYQQMSNVQKWQLDSDESVQCILKLDQHKQKWYEVNAALLNIFEGSSVKQVHFLFWPCCGIKETRSPAIPHQLRRNDWFLFSWNESLC